MRRFLLLLGFSLVAAQVEPVYESPGLQQFIQGFILGLETSPNSPDACVSDSSTLFQDTSTVLSDVFSLLNGDSGSLPTLISDGQKLVADLQDFNGDCDFSGLVQNVESIFTAEGVADAVWRYLDNAQIINEDVEVVGECAMDFSKCGQAVGQVFSLMTNWSI